MPVVGSNGIGVWYDECGDPEDPVLLLISGLGSHGTGFAPAFCSAFVDRGLRVIRFDNRDMGFSTHDEAWQYTLEDMAADAFGLLDALGIERAHLWGTSMGGMIAQTMAIAAPERVATLTSVMSSTGEPGVGGPDPAILPQLLELSRPVASAEEAVELGMAMARLIGSGPDLFDEAEHRRRQTEQSLRHLDPGGTQRQLMAVVSSPSRTEALRRLTVPTLVIHGTHDRLADPSGGRHLAELVPGARLLELEGMGHDLPSALWPLMVEATIDHIAAHAA